MELELVGITMRNPSNFGVGLLASPVRSMSVNKFLGEIVDLGYGFSCMHGDKLI
jgi:hypothetical protein